MDEISKEDREERDEEGPTAWRHTHGRDGDTPMGEKTGEAAERGPPGEQPGMQSREAGGGTSGRLFAAQGQ